MNRIDKKFQELRDQGARAFMPYVCAGDPNPELTAKLFLTLEEAGADIVEPLKKMLSDTQWALKLLAQLKISKPLL